MLISIHADHNWMKLTVLQFNWFHLFLLFSLSICDVICDLWHRSSFTYYEQRAYTHGVCVCLFVMCIAELKQKKVNFWLVKWKFLNHYLKLNVINEIEQISPEKINFFLYFLHIREIIFVSDWRYGNLVAKFSVFCDRNQSFLTAAPTYHPVHRAAKLDSLSIHTNCHEINWFFHHLYINMYRKLSDRVVW